MNRSRLDSLHREAMGYGQWARFGGDSCGLGTGLPESTNKPKPSAIPRRLRPDLKGMTPRQRHNHKEAELPASQPLSTRQTPQSKALMYKIHYEYERIHKIYHKQPEEVKKIVILLYYLGLPFRDVVRVIRLPSRKVGDMKSCFLNAIAA